MNRSRFESGRNSCQADARLRWGKLSDERVAITRDQEEWMRGSVVVMARAAAALARSARGA